MVSPVGKQSAKDGLRKGQEDSGNRKVTNKLHNTSLHAAAELIPQMKVVKRNVFPAECIVNLGLLYIYTDAADV